MLVMIGQNHESFDEDKETGVNLVLGSFNVILLAQGFMVEDHLTIVFYPHMPKMATYLQWPIKLYCRIEESVESSPEFQSKQIN